LIYKIGKTGGVRATYSPPDWRSGGSALVLKPRDLRIELDHHRLLLGLGGRQGRSGKLDWQPID
jgi:hypothetical protein